MTPCLVVTHAHLGRELVRAAEEIAGPVPGLACLCNEGRSLRGLAAAIEDWLADARSTSGAGAILLVDDRCGSCCQAVQLAGRGKPGVFALAGVNLAMLLTFASAGDSLPVERLVQKLHAAGSAAVQTVALDPCLPHPQSDASESP